MPSDAMRASGHGEVTSIVMGGQEKQRSDTTTALQIAIGSLDLLDATQEIGIADDHPAATVFSHIGQATFSVHHKSSHRNHRIGIIHPWIKDARPPSQELSQTTHARAVIQRCTEAKLTRQP